MRMDMTTGTDRRVKSDHTVFIDGDCCQCQPLRITGPVFDNMPADAASATQDGTPADVHKIAICHRDRR